MNTEHKPSETCRICFQTFLAQQKKIKISGEIEAMFFSITHIELRSDSAFSNKICWVCWKDLNNFESFKLQISKNQLELYQKNSEDGVKSVVANFLEVNIKQEQDGVIVQDEVDDSSRHEEDNYEDCAQNSDSSYQEDLPKPKPTKTRRSKEKLKPKYSRRAKTGVKYNTSRGPKPPGVSDYKWYGRKERLCPDCGKNVKKLSEHRRRKHLQEANFICDFCGYKNIFRSRLEEHIIRKHKPEMAEVKKCPHCDFSSIYPCSIQAHVKQAHENLPESTFECHCGKTFKNKYLLAGHIKIVHKRDLKYKCSYCPKAYSCKPSYETHVMTFHTKVGIKDKVCEICAKLFVCERALKNHIRKMHTEGTIPCTIEGCSRKVHTNQDLRKHLISHSKEKKFHCEKCPAKFPKLIDVEKHFENSHMGLRFHCPVADCKKKFKKKENLKLHLRKQHVDLDKETQELFMEGAIAMPIK